MYASLHWKLYHQIRQELHRQPYLTLRFKVSRPADCLGERRAPVPMLSLLAHGS